VLKHFTGGDGANPWAGLVLGEDTLYGTTYKGGGSGYGTVFQMNTNGSGFSLLKSLSYGDGVYPEGALVLSGSRLYGTAASGGMYLSSTGYVFNTGTVFTLELPPEPLVIQSVNRSADMIVFTWNAEVGSRYQVQRATDPATIRWDDSGDVLTATNAVSSASDGLQTFQQSLYRVVRLR
jgi:uncharacterized repeat protein (TIGR03803 family)